MTLSGMGILAMVDVIIVLAVSLATSMVEVGVEWRTPQQTPPINFFYFLVCFVLETAVTVSRFNFLAVSPRGEKVLRPLVRGLFFGLV